jgi:hypothetical protein
MKTIEDARYLRDSILAKFEMAEIATDPKGVFDLGRAAVVRLDSPVTLCSHRGVVRP